MVDVWKQIDGEHYEVSTNGKVRNSKTKKILSNSTTTSAGYPCVSIYPGMRKKAIHRLMALAFLSKPDDWGQVEESTYHGYTVNHKNGIKSDNRIENLEWVTVRENTIHAWKIGLCGEKTRKAVSKTGKIYGPINRKKYLSKLREANQIA